MPLACIIPHVKPEGIAHQPAVYREIAHYLYVNNLDLRVYTAKRGRMWRVPNIERTIGLYKVALTPTEALSMTPELYLDLCSTPRFLAKPEAPTHP